MIYSIKVVLALDLFELLLFVVLLGRINCSLVIALALELTLY